MEFALLVQTVDDIEPYLLCRIRHTGQLTYDEVTKYIQKEWELFKQCEPDSSDRFIERLTNNPNFIILPNEDIVITLD